MGRYQGTGTNYGGRELDELREPVVYGQGPSGLSESQAAWQNVSADLRQVGMYVETSMNRNAAARQGAAADAANTQGLSPLASYAQAAQIQADFAAEATGNQAEYYTAARNGMPNHMDRPSFWSDALTPWEYFRKKREYDRRVDRATDLMNGYQSNSNSNISGMPEFTRPQTTDIGMAMPTGTQVNPGGPSTTVPGQTGGPVGTPPASTVPAGTGPGTGTLIPNPPGLGYPGPGGPGPGGPGPGPSPTPGIPGVPGPVPPGGGTRPGPVPPGPRPGIPGIPPGGGGTGPGTRPGTGPGTRPGIPGGPPVGPGSGPGGTAPGTGRPGGVRPGAPGTGPGGPGTGPGVGGRPGGGGPGGGGGTSRLMPGNLGAGMGLGEGAASRTPGRGPGGFGAGGAGGFGAGEHGPAGRGAGGVGGAHGEHGATGRGGAGGGLRGGVGAGGSAFGPMGGSARDEDDIEHLSPDYLVETEDIFRSGEMVAPPVIGEALPDYYHR